MRGSICIEALVAALLLAVGIVPLAQASSAAQRLGNLAAQREVASALATEAAEQVRLAEGLDTPAWANRVAGRLPGGTGSVSVTGASSVRIEVRWQAVDAASGCPGAACLVRNAPR